MKLNNMKYTMKSTKKQFRAFCEIRDSGEVNMWDRRGVEMLSGGEVDKEAHIDIIKNFDSYAALYPEIAERN